jgi:hypothetical protein
MQGMANRKVRGRAAEAFSPHRARGTTGLLPTLHGKGRPRQSDQGYFTGLSLHRISLRYMRTLCLYIGSPIDDFLPVLFIDRCKVGLYLYFLGVFFIAAPARTKKTCENIWRLFRAPGVTRRPLFEG